MTTIFRLFIKFFPIAFSIVFLFVLGVFIWAFLGAKKDREQCADAPRLTVDAKTVAKTGRVTGGRSTKTAYNAAFEVESGDILRLDVDESDFSSFDENDEGRVTFRGTKFISFEKK